jgi:hypothetical protein
MHFQHLHHVQKEIIIGSILINLASFSFKKSKKIILNPYHTQYSPIFQNPKDSYQIHIASRKALFSILESKISL